MRKMINNVRLEGRVYQHNLEVKTVSNQASANYGKEFVAGTLDIATDEDGLNVVQVHFTYVTETTASGKKNLTFTTLKSIIDGAKVWITDGKDLALKVRVNTAIALNDFYTRDGNLVSAKRCEGGFVNVIKDLAPIEERNRFDVDIVITGINTIEANPERGIEKDYISLRGAVFNFRNDILPIDLVVKSEQGINYFNSLDASSSNPVFTEVKGSIINTVITQQIEEESAFGAASVRTVSRTTREWVVDWAKPVEYDFGVSDTITSEELTAAIQNRQVTLAEIKKRHDDYIANNGTVAAGSTTTNTKVNIPEGAFKF